MTDKTGGPAFPVSYSNEDFIQEGATLRDMFAAKALGLCFAQYLNYAEVEGFSEDWQCGVAADAYLMADAMLRAREK